MRYKQKDIRNVLSDYKTLNDARPKNEKPLDLRSFTAGWMMAKENER